MSAALVSFREQAIFRMEEKLEHLGKCFDQLDDSDMWWRPNLQSNSIGNLILHLCGNIGQYILSSLDNQPDTRERDAEFEASEGWSKVELLERITSTIQSANAVIQNCSDEALLRQRMVQGFEFDGLGIVLHVVEHLSYHTGQIAYITKLRKAKKLGFYDGFDLNTLNSD